MHAEKKKTQTDVFDLYSISPYKKYTSKKELARR